MSDKLINRASESSCRTQLALPGPQPTAEVKVDQKHVRPDEAARQADAEDVLYKLERFLQSWTPSSPPREVAAPVWTSEDAGRTIAGAEVEPQAPGPAEAMTQARPRGRVVKAAMFALAAAAVGAVFALNFTPGLFKWPLAIAPAGAPTATPPPSETVSGPSNSGSPLLKEGADPERPNAADSVGPPASLSGTASFDDVAPASPAANSSASGDALGTPAEAPPPSEAFNPNPDRTASPPSVGAPIATPASSAAPQEAPPAGEAVKPPAEPEPKAAGGVPGVAQRPGPEPPATRSGNPSGVGEAAKPSAIALDAAPLPPIRPVSFAKPQKTAKPHKAAPEPPARPPAKPEARAAQPPGNPLLRLLRDTFE